MFNPPVAYFISFRTYGTWLHGDERGSVDREHNEFDTPLIAPQRALRLWEQSTAGTPVVLAQNRRAVVDSAIRAVCAHRGWHLHQLNVRTNHVHAVVTAAKAPEPIMNAFKAWSTRRLREQRLIGPDGRVWSRHGSTVYLFTPEKLAEKCAYVRDGQ
ncbi:MAG: transposase [Phycisphaerales bacterium]|nr:transposase [Phycisphaerales bacterium]